MAAARNNLTRRAVLGAAVAAPALFSARAEPGPNREPWDAALAVLREREIALESYLSNEMRRADDAFNAVRRRWPITTNFSTNRVAGREWRAAWRAYQPFEDRLNDLECAHLDAIRDLLRVPAPDVRALATKIELAVDHDVGTLEGGEECMIALKADGLRLSQECPGQSRYPRLLQQAASARP